MTLLQWRRVGQIFGGAGGNNEFESQARSAIIEGVKRRSILGGSGACPPPPVIFFKNRGEMMHFKVS